MVGREAEAEAERRGRRGEQAVRMRGGASARAFLPHPSHL